MTQIRIVQQALLLKLSLSLYNGIPLPGGPTCHYYNSNFHRGQLKIPKLYLFTSCPTVGQPRAREADPNPPMEQLTVYLIGRNIVNTFGASGDV